MHSRQKSKSIVASSCDFSLAETSSLVNHLGGDSNDNSNSQNPSWINLRSLKDMIRQSSSSARNFERSDRDAKENRIKTKVQESGGSNQSLKRVPLGQAKNTYNTNFQSNKNHQTASTQQESRVLNKKTGQYNSCSSLNKLKYLSNASGSSSSHQTSKTVHNPKELLLLPVVDSSNELSDSTLNDLSKEISTQDQVQNRQQDIRMSEMINPLDDRYNTGQNYKSQDKEEYIYQQNFESVPFSQNTQAMNHIDTPQSILLIEDNRPSQIHNQGHEIESLLRSQIAANLFKSEETLGIDLINLKRESDQLLISSPYGQTQELDLQNLQNDELCLNYIQCLTTQQDDDKTDCGKRVSHRLQQNNDDDFQTYMLPSPDDNNSSSQKDQPLNQSSSLNSTSQNFKRQKSHQPSQSRESYSSSTRQANNQLQQFNHINNQIEIRQINLNIEKINNDCKNFANRTSMGGNVGINSQNFSQFKNGQKQLIDLTKRSHELFQPSNIKQISYNINDFISNQIDDKENQNPHQLNSKYNSKTIIEEQQESLRLRLVDKDYDQFCEQIEKIKSSSNKECEKSFKRKNKEKSLDKSFKNNNNKSNLTLKETPQKQHISHNSLDLSVSQSQIKSPISTSQSQPYQILQSQETILLNKNLKEIIESKEDQLQQSPAPKMETTLQQSFKRNRPYRSNNLRRNGASAVQSQFHHVQTNSINLTQCQVSTQKFLGQNLTNHQIDVSQIEQQSSLDMSLQSMTLNPIQEEMNEIQSKLRLEMIQIKKENSKLLRQLESQKKTHEEEISKLQKEKEKETLSRLREAEEENYIIIDGVKQEYQDKINELKCQYQAKIEALEVEHKNELDDKEAKIQRKREKIYKLRDNFDQKRKDYNQLLQELEAYKSKIEEMTQYQLQNNIGDNNKDSDAENLFMTSKQSIDQFKTTNKNNHLSYYTSRDQPDDLLLLNDNPFKNSACKQQTPYQSFDNFIDMKQKTNNDPLELKNMMNQINPLTHNSITSSKYASNEGGNAFNNLSSDMMMNYYFSLSQNQQIQQQPSQNQNQQNNNLAGLNQLNPANLLHEQDSAMNFSFSEVKTSFDNKSSFFDKMNNFGSIGAIVAAPGMSNIDHPNKESAQNKFSILDRISQGNESEDEEEQKDISSKRDQYIIKRKPKSQVTSVVNDDSCLDQSNKILKMSEYQKDTQSQYEHDTERDEAKRMNAHQQSLYDSAILQMESQKSISLQHSQILHQELEPSSENYIDDEVSDNDDDNDEEESKSNLSHKIEDMNASMGIGISCGGSQKITTNIIYTIDNDLENTDGLHKNLNHSNGSENAPEDSGFLSDDGENQERIVNESSLYNEDDLGCSQAVVDYYNQGFTNSQNNGCTDPYLMYSNAYDQDENFIEDTINQQMILTGRSESAMDEQDDEIEGISKCKAINSSYINLKRNNLLISYGRK